MKLIDTLAYRPVELSFGTSGLRGLVKDMTDLECYINTIGFIRFLQLKQDTNTANRIYIAGDLRDSTPRIMGVVAKAIEDCGLTVINCGKIPTPALAYYAGLHQVPCIMITGSHIPADRNGIKFYKSTGETLKSDEAPMKEQVELARQEIYHAEEGASLFSAEGKIKKVQTLPPVDKLAEAEYIDRYINFFPDDVLVGKQILVYQQSAVGRDIIVEILNRLGAKTIPV